MAGTRYKLELGGVAPADATSRYQLLPIIKSLQNEGSIRYSASGISVDLAAFEARKPYPVRDAEGAYRLIGKVRNRGVEASLGATDPGHEGRAPSTSR